MNEDERMSDTLSKWERITKGSSVREMKLVFKVCLALSVGKREYTIFILNIQTLYEAFRAQLFKT